MMVMVMMPTHWQVKRHTWTLDILGACWLVDGVGGAPICWLGVRYGMGRCHGVVKEYDTRV